MRAVFALALVAMAVTAPARGQTVGAGASPGRAAYRPNVQWNDGPFYTTNHWNAYSPRSSPTNELTTTDPTGLPYGSFARSSFGAFTPGQGALLPYDEGFSPYSGYSGWYKTEYQVVPTRSRVLSAESHFFQSAPRLPGARTVGLAQGTLPAPAATPLAGAGRSLPRGALAAKVIQRGAPPAAPRSRGIALYRSIPLD